ncbi:MAG: DEAD/DEAH box helicase [Desulfobacterales bacterium]|nr:DEAD/DEAH box helicase [Desulfobacterales bacterium]
MKFSELDLKPEILRALTDMGYQDLTPIQGKTFSPILNGRDLLARAETGSGKTAACGIPLVQMIDPSLNAIQALILVPTRELALQYVEEIDKISRHTDVVPFAIFGGFSMEIQKAKLRDRVHILVATPGRLIDFLYHTTSIDLSCVRTVVLDEADEMLKMGFIEDVDFIMSCLIHEHQTLLFAATMPEEIDRLIRIYLKEPLRVELNKEQVAPQSLAHHFRYTKRHDRLNFLIEYLKREKISQAIIFCNSRHHGEKLMKELEGKFKSVEYIHGGLEQSRRISIFERFRRNKITFMVATDLAGRGLDFSHISHVINYDYPCGLESYTNRTGRTGRMGRSGIALTFVTDQELKALETMFKMNRIDPVWYGDIPNLQAVSKQNSKEDRKKYFKKRARPVPQTRTLLNSRNDPIRGKRQEMQEYLG